MCANDQCIPNDQWIINSAWTRDTVNEPLAFNLKKYEKFTDVN